MFNSTGAYFIFRASSNLFIITQHACGCLGVVYLFTFSHFCVSVNKKRQPWIWYSMVAFFCSRALNCSPLIAQLAFLHVVCFITINNFIICINTSHLHYSKLLVFFSFRASSNLFIITQHACGCLGVVYLFIFLYFCVSVNKNKTTIILGN